MLKKFKMMLAYKIELTLNLSINYYYSGTKNGFHPLHFYQKEPFTRKYNEHSACKWGIKSIKTLRVLS